MDILIGREDWIPVQPTWEVQDPLPKALQFGFQVSPDGSWTEDGGPQLVEQITKVIGWLLRALTKWISH